MQQKPTYKRNRRPGPDPRVVLDYFMGGLWIMAGVFISFSKELFHSDFFEGNDLVQGWWKWFFGVLFVLYGVFRIYRGNQLYQERKRENDLK
jgi:hypothetical protein